MNRNAGFTLVEILVVIAIIAILGAVMVSTLIPGAKQDARILEAESFIQTVGANLELYRHDRRIGTYPPTSLEGFPKMGKMRNRTNLGIESLVICLQSENFKGAGVLDKFEDVLENLDTDRSAKKMARWGSKELFEIVDPWGNPYVYFNAADYGAPGYDNYLALEDGDGDEYVPTTVKPHVSSKTKSYYNSTGYQLFSAGPDGKFNTDDDIGNW